MPSFGSRRPAVGEYSPSVAKDGGDWSKIKVSVFPGTSARRSILRQLQDRSGAPAPHWGSRAVVVSNHAYSVTQTDYLAVQPNSTYHLSAWLRGEIDAEESAGNWLLRAYYYDANKSALSYTNVDQSSSAPANWTEQGGDFSTPSNAAYVRIQLYNYQNSGWVAWDDLRLTGPQVTTSYCYAGGQRVAMRKNGVLRWLLGDHLGSTAVTAYADGTKGTELRYEAWGETRYAWQDTPTTRRFTGQVEDDTIGLYFYNARYYDAALGRFVQADTVVPSPTNPQSFNRYSYTYNNPLKYTDPSGHEVWMGDGGGESLGAARYHAPPWYYAFTPEQTAYIKAHSRKQTAVDSVDRIFTAAEPPQP